MRLILLILLTLTTPMSEAQQRYRVCFYNVENLFDCEHDEGKADEEFLPNATRHWHFGRFKKKIANIAKVVVGMGGWDAPAIIGLSEVENDYVMHSLTRYSPLKELDYWYIITHSSDARGIDVALMYRRDLFRPIAHHIYQLNSGPLEGHRTRDLLHVTGELLSSDTIDLFVTHFPSRREGTLKSEPLRMAVAQRIRTAVEEIWRKHPQRKVIIMGDFNDEPFDKALHHTLGAHPLTHPHSTHSLYNTHFRSAHEANEHNSSYKFGKQWQMLDQIIVSGGFLDPTSPTRLLSEKGGIFNPPYITTHDERHGGVLPYRTYNGMKYIGGFSDHFPVYIDLEDNPR